jgi:sulfide:quinone oxidoreductase
MEIKQIAPNLFVGAQITEENLLALAREGFTDVVCNRPDAEHPESATSTTMAQIAKGLGIAFHYLPITPGEPFPEQSRRLARVVAKPSAKVFAYCRSGMRAANAWALAQADQSGIYA